MKKKKIILIISIIVVLLLTIGVSLAAYTYTRVGSNQELVLGDIYMHYNEGNGITLTDAYPSENYDSTKYFEFTISGKNTYTEKDIWYEIVLNHGDNISNKTRIEDEFLKFTLVEIKDNVETKVVDGMSYSDLQNKKLYVNTISKNTTNEVNITYRLYMWISSDTVIGNNNQDYTLDEWNNVYASIKVKVSGDFEEKKADEKPLEEKLIATAVSYSAASSSDFSGGLVAINTDGELYNETDSQQEIREYRYTGLDVNNYIFLDTNGNGEQDENEMWRIVGIFKNSNDEWNLKLLRNTVLTSDEIPETYKYDETSYILKSDSTSNKVYWNYDNKATNYTDWTTSTLQYWLNGSDGYFGTLSSSIQNIIDTNYTYYLGGIKISEYDDDTTISAYTNERDASNIWSGNEAAWKGSIALLYPSDYGYSYNSKYWNYQFWINQSVGVSFFQTGWIFQNISAWLLSPIKNSPSTIARFSSLYVGYETPNINECQVRPVLNLISNFGSLQGSGTESDPYKII